ncbi:MAG TPA: SRPBCC family protein [Gammaproteobacteria bacterium]|nr:SRPBCC family protein [Gammaproteobacteria bacterium]
MIRQPHDLHISRLIAAPRGLVWQAWSEPGNLEQWWAPKPWTTALLGFDMRPGGAFRFELRGPGEGEVNLIDGCFLEVLPMERIVFTEVLSEGWRPADPFLSMTAIIGLADEGAGTRYTADVLHKNEADSKRHREMGFEEGWGTVIGQLEEMVKQLQ